MNEKDNRNVFYLRKKNLCRSERRSSKWERCYEYYGRVETQKVRQKFIQDMARHIVTDLRATNLMKEIGGNPFNFAKSHVKESRIVQNRQNKTKPAKRSKDAPKYIQLHKFCDGLVYLGNFTAAHDLNVHYVINLSSRPCSRISPHYTYNVNFNEHAITFHDFVSIVKHVHSIVQEIVSNRRSVLIVCESGVNKSLAVVIGCLLLQRLATVVEAIDYIDDKKLEKYDDWNNLTSVRLKNFLRALEVKQV